MLLGNLKETKWPALIKMDILTFGVEIIYIN